MKLDKHVVDMFTELTKPADDVKMEKTCYGTISVVDGTRYVKLDGSDLLVPAASTVKTSHGDRVTVLMKNHSLTVTGNLTAPATDGEGGSSGEAGTAATIEVGTVTTGEAGSSAAVTNVGTTSAAVFDFVIPRGDKGEKGDTGPQGPQGEKGDTGTWDGTIPDHEHTVSDITDFPSSLPANGGNADTLDGLHESDFLQNLGSWTNGAVKDLILAATKSGFIWISNNVTGMPTAGATWWFGILDCSNTSHRCLRVNSVSNRYRYSIVYNAAEGWTDWVKTNDGGNADTIDGMHASQFMQNLSIWTSGDIKELTLAAGSGCVFINSNVTGMPIENAYWFGMVNASTAHRNLLVFQLSGLYSGYLTYNNGIGRWYGWKSFSDGGNADTLDGLHANEIASNPNLLINPDFRINQRGQAEYTDNLKYTVDRWRMETDSNTESSAPKVSVNDDGVTISAVGCNAYLVNTVEDVMLGKTLTYSVSMNSNVYSTTLTMPDTIPETTTLIRIISAPNKSRIASIGLTPNGYLLISISAMTGNTNHFEWAKLELGSIATPFCPPDPATELAKCQRYYQRLSGLNTTYGVGFIGGTTYATINITLANPMRIAPTITINGEVCVATANHNGEDGVIRTSTWVSGWHSSPCSATVVVDISSANDARIVGNACLLQIRDADSYIELNAEL